MWTRRLLACLILLAVGASAFAFDRPFPPGVKRGTLTPDAYPVVVIDGKPRKLSVSARIWNSDNLIEQPVELRGQNLPVNYTENADGEIDRVWILTPQEQQQALPAAAPANQE